jgi:gluconokinase
MVEYPTYYPQPDWAEQDPETIFSSVMKAMEETVVKCGRDPEEISALTLDCSVHTLLGLAEDKSPVTPILTWEDSRARVLVRRWKEQDIGSDIYSLTGCPLHPMYSSAKIAWWREQEPDLFQKVKTFVSLKAFVLFRLTGELMEDQATVSGSGLLNISNLDWEDKALAMAGISRQQAATVVTPTYIVEGLRPEIYKKTGLSDSTRIVVGSSDAAMSSLGSGTVHSDQMTVMIGTSGAVRRLIDSPTFDSQQRTFCYYLGKRLWFAGGAINNGGNILRWFRDNFGDRAKQEAEKRGESVYTVLSEYAEKASPGADGLLFLPFLAGERSPYWNGNMRGILMGLSLHHGQAHIIRSLMEGVCYRILSVSGPLDELVGSPKEIRVTGGFTHSPLWLQILSDVLGRELMVTGEPEGSVLGAAAFAYHTLGVIDSFKALLDKNPVLKVIHPQPEMYQFYKGEFERYMRTYWKFREEFDQV